MTLQRTLARALLGLGAVLVAGACRDIVSPPTVDFGPALCTLLSQCEGGDWACPHDVEDAFDALPDPEQQDAYAAFLDRDCLADCRSARSCRDEPPLCRGTGAECGEDRQCCGATKGTGSCQGAGAGTCCVPDGAPCALDEDCCGGACNSGHCGNFVCKLVDKDCTSHFECCSKKCDFELAQPTCAENVCSLIGGGCQDKGDCCEPTAECSLGTCVILQGCDGCDPFDPANCCVEQGQLCFLLLQNNETTCAPEDCPPEGAECGSDQDCRCSSGDSADLLCDDASFPHCATCRGLSATCDPSAELEDRCCEGLVCDDATSVCAAP